MKNNSAIPQTGHAGAQDCVLSVDIRSSGRPGGGRLLSDIRFTIKTGECLAIIGPNGSGKSSLLRAISQELTPLHGDIRLRGRSLSALSPQQRARQVAVLAQNDTPDLRLSLEDYVALGRIPHAGRVPRHEDDAIIASAIKESGLQHLRRRSLLALSGGERQRAALARVLAQTPDLVLLDEPTNHLDPPGREELLSLVKSKGMAVVAVLHDLTLTGSFADRVLLLSQGRSTICDTPDKVLISEHLYPVFGLTSFTVPHPETGRALRIFEVPHCA